MRPLEVSPLAELPRELAGPVGVTLAKAVERIPPVGTLSGGCWYEPKWDGFRLVIVRDAASTRVWSKQGRDLTARFPDVVAAARVQVPAGTVVDGEVVIWSGERLNFALLQQRMITAVGKIPALTAAHPASYVAFDVLAAGGRDVRRSTLIRRRSVLEQLAADWKPPLQLSPITGDPEQAAAWMADYRAAGIEGLVAKGKATRYLPGRRGCSRSGRGRRPRSSSAASSVPSMRLSRWSPAGTAATSWCSSGARVRSIQRSQRRSPRPSAQRPRIIRGLIEWAPAASEAGGCRFH